MVQLPAPFIRVIVVNDPEVSRVGVAIPIEELTAPVTDSGTAVRRRAAEAALQCQVAVRCR